MEAAILSIVVFLVLIALGMNVGLSLMLVGVIGYAMVVTPAAAFGVLRSIPHSQASSYGLMVIPMFVLMGNFAYAAGLSTGLYNACNKWLSRLPGNLACGTMLASAGFGAICGSVSATTATMGSIAVPEMRKYGYADRLATGSVAMGGTMGNLIPPSTLMIIYASIAEQSIGRLFAASIIPGIMTAVFSIFTISIMVLLIKGLAPAPHKTPWVERFKSLSGLVPVIVVFGIVLGGMFSGLFTVNQSSALGAVAAAVIWLVKGGVSWKIFTEVMAKSIRTTAMTFLIVVGASVYGVFLNITGFPKILAVYIVGLDVSPFMVMFVMTIIYLILGALMDEIPMLVMTVPLFLPIVMGLGYDGIWFGAYVMLCMAMGVIAPPVGIACFVLAGVVKEVPIQTIYRGAVPYLVTIMVVIACVVVWPDLCYFLPNLFFG